MRQKVHQLKIHVVAWPSDRKDVIEFSGETKNGDFGKFILEGERRISLFRERFSIGSCVDLELYENGIEIARIQRAIDTIEESE